HVSCPAVIAGPNCEISGFEGRSILLSTSLGSGSYRPAQYAAALSEELNAHLTLLHLAPSVDIGAQEDLVRHHLCNEARALLPEGMESRRHLKTLVLFGEDSNCIPAIAAREKADLIVMGVHEGWPVKNRLADHLPSGVLANTIREARCPVLAVRAHFEG
ncbi:MAG TPA: universal stress protein, partial [Acidobacteriaceae bacterium]